MASWFISAAAAAARNAHKAACESETIPVESANNLAGRGEIQTIATAVVMATMALEACCNHHIDILLGNPSNFSEKEIEELEKLLVGKMSSYKKLKSFLQLLRYQDIGRPPYQDAVFLVRLRNSLAHYRVAKSNLELPLIHQRLANHLEVKGIERRPAGMVIYIPLSYLHWRCARWAVDTVLRVSWDLSLITKQADCFLESGFDLSLPSDQR